MTALVAVDGRHVTARHTARCEVVIVGSGPAGATVAAELAGRGAAVIVVEEGHHVPPAAFAASGVRAMAALYRDMGTSLAFGRATMPYLQGCAVGGTSVINGGISWRFPPEILAAWAADDPALGDALPYELIAAHVARLEARLRVHPTESAIAGAKNLLLARGAEATGAAHRPIRRNTDGCVGAGRCLQGCPHGAKLSMDRSLLPDAVARGARIFAGVRALRVLIERGRAIGVRGVTAAGAHVDIRARTVVLAASAIQTPCLLRRSGITHGPVGDGLAAHPGVSVTGRFAEPVRAWEGATQGHEVTGYRGEGIKLEALGFDLSILASRLPGVGAEFARRIAELDRYAVWGAAIRANARGRVRPGRTRPLVTYSLTPDDTRRVRRAVRILGETLLAAGAVEVYPGVPGFEAVVRDRATMARFEAAGSLTPSDYVMSMTHLFGTARMGGDAATSVVRPDFRHHTVAGLYVADSSVFPTNLGVNPQIPIMAMAARCAEAIAA